MPSPIKTPTPRTDAEELDGAHWNDHREDYVVPADFARTLETELATWKGDVVTIASVNEQLRSSLAASQERVRELERVLGLLYLSVNEHESIDEEDYDPAMAHNFNSSFRQVIDALAVARALLNSNPANA
jgi:hypothetical protein